MTRVEARDGSAARPRRRVTRVAWVIALVGLGALGIWIAAPDRATVRAALDRVAAAPLATLAILVAGAVGLAVVEAMRIAEIGRLVGARVGVRAALDAAVANQVMTAVTPTVGLGEPSVAYVLGKRGIAWDVAVAIPFIKFTTSLALVFAIGAVLVVAGSGPPVDPVYAGAGLALFAAIAIGTAAFVAVCAHAAWSERIIERLRGWLARRRWFQSEAWQDRLDRGTKVVRGAAARLGALRDTGWRGTGVLLLVHVIYYAAYVAPLVALALVLADPPVVAISLRALVFLCFMFAMPTPGGVGATEAAAGLFFADLVPLPDAIAIVAVFRAATFYIQVALGLVYVPVRAVTA